jgi:hypothetical protein|tara:strand:- start:460 stop:597 length:138 start_codon:yes stop_codon:yes gene_type:complete
MKRLIQWHKDRMNCMADYFGLSAYQITWAAFAKGLVIGYLLGVYL